MCVRPPVIVGLALALGPAPGCGDLLTDPRPPVVADGGDGERPPGNDTGAVPWRCPVGGLETVNAQVGPAGGVVKLVGAGQVPELAELEIPAGALEAEIRLTITATRDGAPPGHVAESALYRFDPIGLALARAAKVTIRRQGPVGTLPIQQRRGVHWLGGASPWTRLPDSYANTDWHWGTITTLGVGFVGYSDFPGADPCF